MSTSSLVTILAIVAVVAFFSEWIVVKAAYKLKLFDQPNGRKIHHKRIPRLGGVIIYPILLLGLFLLYTLDSGSFFDLYSGCQDALVGLLMAIGVVYIFGFFDDLVNIRYRNKFAAQIFSGVALCLCGVMIDSFCGFIGIAKLPTILAWAFTIFAVIYVSNAINFIDGIDGLAASLSTIALIYYAVIFNMMAQMGLVFVCLIAILALLAFEVFNLFGKSERATKVFMGDAGSLSMGVLLCGLGIMVLQHFSANGDISGNFALAVAPLMLPCFDVVRVVITRWLHGKNVFEADKSHIHHKFLSLGLSQRQTLLCLVGFDLLMLLTAVLLLPIMNVNLIILLEVLLFMALVQLINRKLKNKQI